MQKSIDQSRIARIIDANINRLKEGLRVCEEVSRFYLNNPKLSKQLKTTRHTVDTASKIVCQKNILLAARNVSTDVGRINNQHELTRKTIGDIFFANIQRAKESTRVLEEFSKLIKPQAAFLFKDIRYQVYEIEKKASLALQSLRHYR